MPIDGLTEINRTPRNGMIRLGIKKKTSSGKEYPAEVDYFILDPETPEEEEKHRIIRLFLDTFGANPKAIEIMLLSSDINEAFPQNYKRYGKSTPLKCIGDGKTAIVTDKEWGRGLDQVGVDDRGYMQVRCDGRDCIYATTNEKSSSKECKATATLTVKIHQLGGLGIWQLTTGSFNSIVNINSGIRDLVNSYGRADHIPLMLERRPQETAYKGKKTTHYTLHLNEAKNTAEAARALQANVGIPDEAPPEILDGYHEPEKPIVVNHPPVDIENMDKQATETTKAISENGGAYPAEPVEKFNYNNPEPDKSAEKVIEALGGEVVEEDRDAKGAKESKEFLEGLKRDSKEELGVEGGKPVKSRAIDKEKKKAFPEAFPKFMAFCKAKLEGKGIGDMYHETFKLYFVDNPLKLQHDTKKQGEIRVYLEALLEEQGLV